MLGEMQRTVPASVNVAATVEIRWSRQRASPMLSVHKAQGDRHFPASIDILVKRINHHQRQIGIKAQQAAVEQRVSFGRRRAGQQPQLKALGLDQS